MSTLGHVCQSRAEVWASPHARDGEGVTRGLPGMGTHSQALSMSAGVFLFLHIAVHRHILCVMGSSQCLAC